MAKRLGKTPFSHQNPVLVYHEIQSALTGHLFVTTYGLPMNAKFPKLEKKDKLQHL